RLFGNRWLPQTTFQIALDAQAAFCRRRHQPRSPPLAKMRPGRPAPAMGPGTGAAAVPITWFPTSPTPVKLLELDPNHIPAKPAGDTQDEAQNSAKAVPS